MSNELLDKTKPPRAGEELDAARLSAYLADVLKLDATGLAIEQFPGGHSNLTYLIKAGGREYVLRRPPFGSKVKSAHDMGREYRVLSKLSAVWSKAPRPVAYCEDESVMGAKFYLMERLRGIILRRVPPAGLDLSPPVCRRLCENFVDTLAELHQLDYAAAGLGDFGKPDGYVERQVKGWTERYHGSKTDDIAEVLQVADWLAANLPASPPATVIHNDYKFDNLILDPADPTRILGLLDWEMSTLGDPLMDLGTALCYWVDEADDDAMKMIGFGPTTLPGMMTRRELAERYAAKTGTDLSHIAFYYIFGLFKTAVVVQQIYYRYAKGLTQDERFANLIYGVRIMCEQAARYLDRREL